MSKEDFVWGFVVGAAVFFFTVIATVAVTATPPVAYTGTVQATFVSNTSSNGNGNGQVLINLTGVAGNSSITCNLTSNAQNNAALINLKQGDDVTIVQYSVGFGVNTCIVSRV